MRIRSRSRDRSRGGGKGADSDLLTLLSYGATDVFDFVANQYVRGGLVGPSGLTVTRASSGYAETSDGRLVEFGSGVLRRTDKGVLVEGARTNLLTYSQAFDNAAWGKPSGAFTANAMTAPDGTLTADRYAPNISASINDNVYQNVTVVNGSTYTYSGFLKYIEGADSPWIEVTTVNPTLRTWINIQTGTLGTAGHASPIVKVLADGWVYFAVSLTVNSTFTQTYVSIRPDDNEATPIVSTGAPAYAAYGFQLEPGPFPSSYIKTEGSTVTRAADQVTASLSGVAYPASLFAEIERVVDTGAAERWVEISFDASNVAYIRTVQGTPDNGGFVMDAAGSTVANITGASIAALDTSHKLAVRVATDDVRFCVNSTLATLDTSAALPSNPTTIDFSKSPQPFGYIRRCAIFNTALTDTELEILTTPALPPLFASFDLINGTAQYAGSYYSDLATVPGYSFTRASDAYYTKADGTLQLFSSGALRRGDKGVLIEGARTNLLLRSQEFDNAGWTKSGATVTANAIAAPDGTLTADYVVETANTNSHQINQSYTYTAAAHTWSCFVKPNGRQWCRLMIFDGTSFKAGWFDILNGIIGTLDAGITATLTALADGWYRPSITYTCAAGAGGVYLHGATSDGGADTYLGEITKGYYLWGAQLEAASFPSSYIPTAASTVTRAADVLTIGSVTGLDYPLSIAAEYVFDAISAISDQTAFGIDDSTGNNRAVIARSSGTTTAVNLNTVSGGVSQGLVSPSGSATAGVVVKGAGRITTNDLQAARDGTLGTADTSATNPATPNRITIGFRTSSQDLLFGLIRSARIYSGAASDYWLKRETS